MSNKTINYQDDQLGCGIASNLTVILMRLIDSHCHLDLAVFDADRDAVLQRSWENGVTDVVVPAVQASGWEKIRSLSDIGNLVNIHVAYGLHPVFERQHKLMDLMLLEALLRNENSIAVGECGLDFFIDHYDQLKQLEFFTGQLDLAIQFELPVIIHSRKSLDLVLKELRLRPSLTGVIHSFSGSIQQAKQLIDLGFFLGFGGPITYSRARKLRGLVAKLPLESLLLETDAPDQPDASHYKERNEPSWLPQIASCVAELKGISVESVAEITTGNCRRLLGL